MKRIVSTLLLLALFCTLLPVQSFAAEKVIDNIQISELRKPEFGATPDFFLDVPDDAPYNIDLTLNAGGYHSGVRWEQWGMNPMELDSKFESYFYVLYIALRPKAGYRFSETPNASVLHGAIGSGFVSEEGVDKGCFVLSYQFKVDSYKGVVDRIEISSLDLPIAGNNPDFEIYVPSGGGYRIDTSINTEGYVDGVIWMPWQRPELSKTDVFEKDDLYLVYICLVAEDGCSFASDITANSLWGSLGSCHISETGITKGRLIVGYMFTAAPKTSKVSLTAITGGGSGTVKGAGEYPTGSVVTVKAYPSMGYGFYGWSGEGDRFITSSPDYSFTVLGDTVLFADFVKAPFTDICGRDYYYDPVRWAVEEGITAGISATEFGPSQHCTRAQAVTFLWRFAGCPEPLSSGKLFEDTEADAYYSKAVAWAVENGITAGTGKTTFSPDDPCTRAQIVTFLWRMANKPEVNMVALPFTDVPADAYYAEAVEYAYYFGITAGTSETTFSPDAYCTRGQIVSFLWRALSKG